MRTIEQKFPSAKVDRCELHVRSKGDRGIDRGGEKESPERAVFMSQAPDVAQLALLGDTAKKAGEHDLADVMQIDVRGHVLLTTRV